MSDKIYDLEDRTSEFARRVIRLCKALPRNVINLELIKQIMKSGPSTGANYREANEALSRRDFLHKMKISRKECKETIYWLELIIEANPDLGERIKPLINEAIELKKILLKIIENSEKKSKK